MRHLSEALWARQISRHGTTKVTPFKLVFGQEVVLPIEVNLQAIRVAQQNSLTADEYKDLMMDRLDESMEKQCDALKENEKEK
jgi:hypothetical protein